MSGNSPHDAHGLRAWPYNLKSDDGTPYVIPSYAPQNPVLRWFEARLPVVGLLHSAAISYPTPRNLNYWWTFGGILTFMLVVQIVTGIILVMHFTPHVDMAFNSVEGLRRDVN